MKTYPFHIVNAFGVGPQSGNPAGVCILDEWLSTKELQGMAQQLNLPETAFVIPAQNQSWSIRWFTVKQEIDLCGHATLAAAHCLFSNGYNQGSQKISFRSKSGQLDSVYHKDSTIEIFLPSVTSTPGMLSTQLVEGLGAYPEGVWTGTNYLCLFDQKETVESLQPDFLSLLTLRDGLGVIATAACNSGKYHFVSRYFAPRIGVNEDHATGSAHCMLVPFWSKKLNKTDLVAYQSSPRGGRFYCQNLDNTVSLRGNAESFLSGELSF
jgi:PhzF family phenazine biosynthesis protein